MHGGCFNTQMQSAQLLLAHSGTRHTHPPGESSSQTQPLAFRDLAHDAVPLGWGCAALQGPPTFSGGEQSCWRAPRGRAPGRGRGQRVNEGAWRVQGGGEDPPACTGISPSSAGASSAPAAKPFPRWVTVSATPQLLLQGSWAKPAPLPFPGAGTQPPNPALPFPQSFQGCT